MTLIEKGQCGYLDCTKDNVPGLWPDEGSWMCEEHRQIIGEIRLNLKKANKWDKEDRTIRCARGGTEFCMDCIGPPYCDLASIE